MKSNGVELLGREEPARVEVVVLRQVVAEGRALDQDHAALVAEQPTDAEAGEHHQHRQVEEQVADLAQIAALGADRVALAVGGLAEPVPLAEDRAGPVEDLVGRHVGLVRHVVGQAGQVARRLGGCARSRLRVDEAVRGTMQPTSDSTSSR